MDLGDSVTCPNVPSAGVCAPSSATHVTVVPPVRLGIATLPTSPSSTPRAKANEPASGCANKVDERVGQKVGPDQVAARRRRADDLDALQDLGDGPVSHVQAVDAAAQPRIGRDQNLAFALALELLCQFVGHFALVAVFFFPGSLDDGVERAGQRELAHRVVVEPGALGGRCVERLGFADLVEDQPFELVGRRALADMLAREVLEPVALAELGQVADPRFLALADLLFRGVAGLGLGALALGLFLELLADLGLGLLADLVDVDRGSWIVSHFRTSCFNLGFVDAFAVLAGQRLRGVSSDSHGLIGRDAHEGDFEGFPIDDAKDIPILLRRCRLPLSPSDARGSRQTRSGGYRRGLAAIRCRPPRRGRTSRSPARRGRCPASPTRRCRLAGACRARTGAGRGRTREKSKPHRPAPVGPKPLVAEEPADRRFRRERHSDLAVGLVIGADVLDHAASIQDRGVNRRRRALPRLAHLVPLPKV